MNPLDLNTEDRALFDRIVSSSPSQLTPNDKKVLRARRDYLTDAQREDFKEILEASPEDDEPVGEEKAPLKEEKTAADANPSGVGETGLEGQNADGTPVDQAPAETPKDTKAKK